uniref:Spectrin repeat containing, nuclear envelope family member 3 n=1 Tax=Cyclopterus lumpus TaxID=8103 RepID=A0A8C2XSF9_CYCLU
MTQQEQQEFMESLEAALSWMRAIQERLKANDNTQGPLDALEGRLRETEKIHQSEHEGRVKMDMALVAAENLLQSGDEELRTHTHTKLKDLKGLWEETSTYIIHCHSRIEWVWLHWGEYLKAYEEFELWLTSRQRGLDVAVELQLGVKEKLWQADQQRVVVSDIHGQAALLERLLDEAAALHNRTQDPSVEPQAQERLQEAYNDVRDRAEERLSLLQKIAEEHQMYQGCVQRFQSWLLSKTKELTDLMERKDAAENKLRALQVLDDSVASEEKTLQHIEGVAEAVRGNTSPSGAEMVMEEAEELRLGWQRLRQGLCESEEGLRSSLDSHSQYMARCQRLGEDIGQLRVLLQGLDQELEEGRNARGRTDRTEEQMVGQWRKYTGVRNTLAGEESQVELLKAQLKELFRFSQDSRHLSDDVLAVVKEHQSVKCRATRLCSESESGLRNVLHDPLLVFAQWSHMVSQVLEASAEVTDFSHIAMLVQGIERLLKGSVQLQERLSLLQVKGDLLTSLFGPEGSDSLQSELSGAIRNRELLHAQLLQRKSRLQGLISRTKDFGDAQELIRSKLAALQDHLVATDGLQPDILAKKSQSDQFRVILKDLEDCEAHITALETLVSSSQSNRAQFERLYAEWKHLHKAARVKVHESEESIADHESFHDSLLNIEKWLMIMKQKLESFHSPPGEWSIEGRQHEAERALGEFPEKELQLQQMEVQGQGVLERTSEEGRVHIQRDIKRLRESWLALYNTSLNLHRYLKYLVFSDTWRVGGLSADREVGEGVMTARGGRIQGHGEGHLILAGQDYEHVSPSRSGGDRGRSFRGDQVDSSAWRIRSRAGQREASTVTGCTGEYTSRRREFEAWLSKENKLLSGIFSSKGATLSDKEVKTRQDTLRALRAGVGWGQEQFQLLLQESPGSEDVSLEELRYHWMLYKSKLKDVGDLRSRASAKPGLWKRVCRLALPLWLLLLALLLLAFLLPLMDGNSCSLSNNFARSFNVMLRYEAPPPT